jgi:hypothetical protein
MKKIVLSSLLVATFSFSYEGCGVTKNDALDSLSKSIYVSVKNKLDKKESFSESMFSMFFSKKIDTSSSQTSSVILKNVTFSNKNGEVCAYVSEENVKKSANVTLTELKQFKMSSLPTTFEQKQKTINSTLEKISFVKAVLTLSPTDLRTLNNQQTTLTEKASYGAVVFNTNLNSKITISNYFNTVSPSQEVELKEGKYSYKISATNKCPIEGQLEVKKGKLVSIDKEAGDYPQITFKSNLSANEIKVTLDGKPMVLDQAKTIQQCNGDIVWSMEYDTQKKDGIITLEPNLKEIIEQEFISTTNLKKVKAKADYFTKSTEININFGYSVDSNDSTDSLKRFEISYLHNKGIFKWGYTLAVASPEKFIANDINTVELLVDFRVQFPELLDTNVRISTLPVIPYLGVSGGIDVYNVIKDATDNGMANAEWNFSDSPLMLRGVIGFDILFHKQFGINFNYQRDFLDKEDNIFNAGIVLAF